MMKVLERGEDGCRRRMISWNIFNRSYRGSLKVWQPKWAGLQDLQTWKGQRIIQGKNFIQCMGVVTIKIYTSIKVAIGRSTSIVLRFLFVLNLCYFPKKIPVHCAHPNKGHCMVSWLNKALPSQFHLGIPWRLKRVSSMYHIEWGGGTTYVAGGLHLFCPAWILLRNDYTRLVRRGGGSTKS